MPLHTWWSSSLLAMSKSSRSRARSNSINRESQISFDDGCEGYRTISRRPNDQLSDYQTGLAHNLSSFSINTLETFASIDDDKDNEDDALSSHYFLSRNDQSKSDQDFGAESDNGSSSKSSSLYKSSKRGKKPSRLQSTLTGGSLKPFGSKPALVILDGLLGHESPSPPRARQEKKGKSKFISERRKNGPTIVPPVPPVPEIHLSLDHSNSTLTSSYRARTNSTASWATTLDGSRTLSSIDLDSRPSRVDSQSSRFALDDDYSMDEWESTLVPPSIGQSTSKHPSPPPRLRSLSLSQTAVHTTQPTFPRFPLTPSPSATSSSSAYREEHPIGPIRSHSLSARDPSDSYLVASSTVSNSSCIDPKYPLPYPRHSPQSPVFQPYDDHHYSQPPVIPPSPSPLPSPNTLEHLILPTPAPKIGRRISSKILTTLFFSSSKAEPVPEMVGRTSSIADKGECKERRNMAKRTLPSPLEGGGGPGHHHTDSPKGSFFRKKRTMYIERKFEKEKEDEGKNGMDKKREGLLLDRDEGDNELRRSYESDIEAVTAKLLPLFTLPPRTSVVLEPPPVAFRPLRPSPCGSNASEPLFSTAATPAASTPAGLGRSYSLPIKTDRDPSSDNQPAFINPFELLLPHLPVSPSCLPSPSPHKISSQKSPDRTHDFTNSVLCPSILELTPVPNSPTPTIIPEVYSKMSRPLPSLPPRSPPREENTMAGERRLYQLGRSSSENSNLTNPARSSLESEGESLVLLYLSSSTLSD
ncbi:hypothetical protein [Phaffia rhodozyma]|uniref:Uncharacterized protein n=1 Tax=Phaffia rhodozyma TaxID=264483 RepID=A0A0F7SXV7_PHARH|nr:hypothetical protein [Phaffia rhodozyma]